jgi:hypothetical protein
MTTNAVDPQLVNLTSSFNNNYLLGKFEKHYNNSGSYNINTVFKKDDFENQSDYDIYEQYHYLAYVSGSLEIDNQGRKNLVLCYTKPTGDEYTQGIKAGQSEAVKLVLFDNANKIHAFPTSSAHLTTVRCKNCGCKLEIYDPNTQSP